MPLPYSPKRVWRGWTAPTVEGDLARRREAVLLETLATLVVFGLIAQCVQLATQTIGPRSPQFWLWGPAVTATTASFYGLLRLARSGRHRTSAGILIVVLSVVAFGLLADDGIDHSVWPLLSAATVLLAALLLGRKSGAITTGVHCVALAIVAGLEVSSPSSFTDPGTASFGNAAAPTLLLLLITRTCWLYTREIVTGIDEVLSHGSESSPLRQLRTKALSVREIEVVQLVAEGLTNDAIGKRLFLSPRTVQSHVANAMGKSETSNRTELGVLAIREGLVPIEAPAGETHSTAS